MNDLPNIQPTGPVSPLPTVAAPMDLVRAALATGNIEIYREAVALAQALDAIAARKAFDNAMADFRGSVRTIKRNRSVDSGGKGPKYRFEDLGEIAATIDQPLAEHGLSYRYRVHSEPGKPVTVTCIVTHRAGHYEETSITAGLDNGPGRNGIQQVGSTVTYLQRYTLKAALGLAVSNDDDGRSLPIEVDEPEYVPPPGSICAAEVAELRMMLEDKGASEKAFLQWAKVARIEAIHSNRMDACRAAITGFKKH